MAVLSFDVLSGNTSGKIAVLGVNRFDEALVKTDGTENYQECAAEFKRYVADLNTNYGRAMYSMMLSAKAQKKSIKITGKNLCDVRDDAESIQYIEILD